MKQSLNQSLNVGQYELFEQNVVTQGTILWRMHDIHSHVVVLNDYNAHTGMFMPLADVNTTRTQHEGVTTMHCSCRTHLHLQSVALSHAPDGESCSDVFFPSSGSLMCMHSRFFLQHLEKHCESIATGSGPGSNT